jgi:phosphoribosylformylglycinamidine cyclo-ligase
MTAALRAMTYAAAGVDIAAGDRLIRRIAALARSTRRPEVITDVEGFVVERRKVIDGRATRPGDVLIGLPSTGLHSNGFALARRVLLERARLPLGRPLPGLRGPLGLELLRPTRIYVRTVRELLARLPGGAVHAMAHVTGGGLPGNLPRVLPPGCHAAVRRGSWRTPAVFAHIERLGRVPRAEMDQAFNNGIGFVLVVAAAHAARALRHLHDRRTGATVIGEVVGGRPGLTFT